MYNVDRNLVIIDRFAVSCEVIHVSRVLKDGLSRLGQQSSSPEFAYKYKGLVPPPSYGVAIDLETTLKKVSVII